MRLASVAPLAALAVLTACGSNEDSSDAPKTLDEVKAETAKLVKPDPGRYRSTVKLTKFEVPGMPAAQAEKMKAMFASSGQSSEFCMTKAQTDKGFEEMAKAMAQGNCTYDRYTADGGTLDAKMTCQTGQGMTSVVEMAGTVAPTQMQMTMKMNNTMPGLPVSMTIEADVQSQRIGDCKT